MRRMKTEGDLYCGSLNATDFVEAFEEICSSVPCEEREGVIILNESASNATNESCNSEREDDALGIDRLVFPILFHVFCDADNAADKSADDAEEDGGKEDLIHRVLW